MIRCHNVHLRLLPVLAAGHQRAAAGLRLHRLQRLLVPEGGAAERKPSPENAQIIPNHCPMTVVIYHEGTIIF